MALSEQTDKLISTAKGARTYRLLHHHTGLTGTCRLVAVRKQRTLQESCTQTSVLLSRRMHKRQSQTPSPLRVASPTDVGLAAPLILATDIAAED